MNAIGSTRLEAAETGTAAGTLSKRPADDPRHMAQAAGQFESLLIAQLLKSMRSASSGGWLGTGGDSSASSVMELAEEQLAESLAHAGGLGLARLVVSGLERAQTGRPTAKLSNNGVQPAAPESHASVPER